MNAPGLAIYQFGKCSKEESWKASNPHSPVGCVGSHTYQSFGPMAKGQAEMFIKLLESKFGLLEETQRAYIYCLDSEALGQYSSKLWTAQMLEEIFTVWM